MNNNLPQGVNYEDTISDPWSIKPKTYNFMLDLNKLEKKLDEALEKETTESLNQFLNKERRINPCQGHAFSDEGAESLEELNIELPLKCVYFKDYNLCSSKNICEQCKID